MRLKKKTLLFGIACFVCLTVVFTAVIISRERTQGIEPYGNSNQTSQDRVGFLGWLDRITGFISHDNPPVTPSGGNVGKNEPPQPLPVTEPEPVDPQTMRIQYKLSKNAVSYQELERLSMELKGEALQSALKNMNQHADKGGNDRIIEAFIDRRDVESEIERYRMLSYLNPDYPLSKQTTQDLMTEYDEIDDEMLKSSILNILASTCGKKGISFVIDQLNTSATMEEWKGVLEILSRSGSEDALASLHVLLNRLAKNNKATEEQKEAVRQAILQMNSSRSAE